MATARKFREETRKGLHIEAEGCIVNVYEGLKDLKGRKVTAIEIIPDDRVSGEPPWKLYGARNNRVVELKKVYK